MVPSCAMNPAAPRIRHSPDSRNSFRTHKNFHPGARNLRAYFESLFSDPYSTRKERFCWDLWNVPGQYRLLRTPAAAFFPQSLYSRFLRQLLAWGRDQLGCQMISHPWLSAYTDDCHQALHSDVPHGPFSFVYSLTPWQKRTFSGGETLLATPVLLRYFSEMQSGSSHEEKSLIREIPPRFNQLTVFDPRFPHGVRMVHGAESILDARLVIHGWFTEPRPMLEGALPLKKVLRPMDRLASEIMDHVNRAGGFSGLLSLRVHVNETGRIACMDVLNSNLLNSEGRVIPKSALERILQGADVSFPPSAGKTRITLPLLFQR
jgi:hypothetical protein